MFRTSKGDEKIIEGTPKNPSVFLCVLCGEKD
jgi:hypothetical protein